MSYRNLTSEQFTVIKNATAKVCTQNDLKTIGDFKRVGNLLIDAIENEKLTYADLLRPVIAFDIPK
jgi:hypothetical protein